MKKDKIVAKIPNELCFISSDLVLTQYKLLYSILQKIGTMIKVRKKVEEKHSDLEGWESDNMYCEINNAYYVKVKISEIQELTSKNLTLKEIFSIADELMDSRIKFKRKGTYSLVGVFGEISYNPDEKHVTFYFIDSFLNLFWDTTNDFTLLDLMEMSRLRSTYSFKLYMFGMKYRKLGVVTRQYKGFRDDLSIPDTYKTHEITRTIKKAISDIETNTNLKISFSNVKTGRDITHIKFSIKYNASLYENDKSELPKVSEDEIPW